MQYTKRPVINEWIDQIHQITMKLSPKITMKEQPGFRSNNYMVGSSMKDTFCYIICYDQKTNLGFSQGVDLIKEFPLLKGTGKTHRHLEINEALMNDQIQLKKLIQKALQKTSLTK